MTAPRYDAYAFIHKGLRAFMAHTLLRVGRLDAHDVAEVAETSQEVLGLLDMCAAHLRHENAIVHPAMEARHPGASRAIADDHVGHEQAIARLRACVAALPGDDAAARTLYRELAEFVAHNFEHMAMEESHGNAILWATYSDDELRALEARIKAGIQPDEMRVAMRWMLPHMSPAERAEMLRGMRQSAPAEVFDGVLALVRPLLGGRDWLKLSNALGL